MKGNSQTSRAAQLRREVSKLEHDLSYHVMIRPDLVAQVRTTIKRKRILAKAHDKRLEFESEVSNMKKQLLQLKPNSSEATKIRLLMQTKTELLKKLNPTIDKFEAQHGK